jgi:hypothetical protein
LLQLGFEGLGFDGSRMASLDGKLGWARLTESGISQQPQYQDKRVLRGKLKENSEEMECGSAQPYIYYLILTRATDTLPAEKALKKLIFCLLMLRGVIAHTLVGLTAQLNK